MSKKLTPQHEIANEPQADTDYDVGFIKSSEPAQYEVDRAFYGDSISESYRLKSELISNCMSEIGMGRYQWELFIVSGFGWATDNFWSQGITAIQPAVALEFSDIRRITISSIAYYTGMIIGSFFWGVLSDFIGRKPAFMLTITIGGAFGMAVAGLESFEGFCVVWCIIGTAAGGNVPVDSMIFLEFVPGSHQWLLTALSGWWNAGQLIVSLFAWIFLAKFSCATDAETCNKGDNMGWRYLMLTLGSIALVFAIIRVLIFKMPESPRFLLAKGRDSQAVDAINFVARRNKCAEPLTLSMLQEIDSGLGINSNVEEGRVQLSKRQIIQDNFKDFEPLNYRSLFATKKLGLHTSLVWLIWLVVGIAYPLFFNFLPTYLAQKFEAESSLDQTYRTYCIVSAVGVVGPISASLVVNTRIGRRWSMGGSAIIAGAFLYGYTAASSEDMDLAFNCITSLWANFMYAIMYAFTPESFPGPHRGLGTGQAATLLRLGGLTASLVGTYTGFTVVPMYVSAALWILVGLSSFGLPFETHGRAAI